MELKPIEGKDVTTTVNVLIVPFMELKQVGLAHKSEGITS